MNDLSFVRERIAAGDQARFFHDYYGQQWIELGRGRIFKRKTRVRLLPEEIMQAKAALEGRHVTQRSRRAASLVVPHNQARYEPSRVSSERRTLASYIELALEAYIEAKRQNGKKPKRS